MTYVLKHIFLFRREPDLSWDGWKKAVYYAYRPLSLLCAGSGMGLVLLILE